MSKAKIIYAKYDASKPSGAKLNIIGEKEIEWEDGELVNEVKPVASSSWFKPLMATALFFGFLKLKRKG